MLWYGRSASFAASCVKKQSLDFCRIDYSKLAEEKSQNLKITQKSPVFSNFGQKVLPEIIWEKNV